MPIEHPRIVICLIALVTCIVSILYTPSDAASGTEGASFLDIPVGAGPAAMGAAYIALANDAYAATLNPAGLGFLPALEFAAQHLAYLDTIHYEYLGFGAPIPMSGRDSCSDSGVCARSAWGGSIQYLGSGDVTATDASGNSIGNFSSHYAAYNLAYGRAVTDRLSLGTTAKWINAEIEDVSANAYAFDFGSMYRTNDKLTLAAVLTNVGTKLTFLQEGDSLPLAFHAGAAYQLNSQWNLSGEAVFPEAGIPSAHVGIEWHPMPMFSFRTGYQTETVEGLGVLAGFSTGIGIQLQRLEFSYAWLPIGDLGNTQYFSLTLRLGQGGRAKRNLIQYGPGKTPLAENDTDRADDQDLMELLSNEDALTAQHSPH